MTMLLTIGLLASAAYPQAAARPASRVSLQAELNAARAEIAAQRRQLDAQEARLRALEDRVARAPAAPPTPPLGSLAQASLGGAPGGDPAIVQQSVVQPPLERVGQRPADRDRPPEVAVLGSEGSVVTRKGQLTGEVQVDYTRADRNRALFRGDQLLGVLLIGQLDISESQQNLFTGSLAARYGVTDKLEIGARVPFVHRTDNTVLGPVPGSTNNDPARESALSAKGTGIGDVELTARYQLAAARGGWPFLVGNLQVVAPTGSNPFGLPRNANGEALKAATGSGFWGVSPSVTAILPTDPAVLFGTIGYTHNFGRSVNTIIDPVQITYVKPGDSLSFSAGIGVSLNERTSLNLGYAQSWAFGTLTRTVLLKPVGTQPAGPLDQTGRDLQLGRLLFGVTYRATDRASINWSVEVGATEDAPDVRTVLRLPLQLLTP